MFFLKKSEMRADAESSSNGDVYSYINVSSCMYLEVEYVDGTPKTGGVRLGAICIYSGTPCTYMLQHPQTWDSNRVTP